MRKTLLIIFLFFSLFCKAQFGNQDSVELPTAGYTESTVKGLLHLPADYATVKHPLIINFEGNGNAGTLLKKLLGPKMIATHIANGWTCTALNPTDNLNYEFVIWSPLPTHTNPAGFSDWLSHTNVKPMLTALIANYNIDVTRIYFMGLSAGGFSTLDCILKDTSIANKVAAVVLASAEGDGSFPALLCNIPAANIAYWAIYEQGEAFSTLNQQYVTGINACSPLPIPAIQTRLPGSNHDGWYYADDSSFSDVASGNLSAFEWVLKYKKGNVTPPVNTIILNPVTSPICVTNTAGTSFAVTGTSTGTFAVNTYTLQLSSQSGSFASPTNIGSQTTNSNSISFTATIPAGSATGNAWKVRLVSNGPAVVSNVQTITINLAANVISPATTQTIAVGAPGAALTVTNTSAPTGIQWFANNSLLLGQTFSTYTPQFASAGPYVVTEKSTFTGCGTITSNPVTINVISVVPTSHRIILTKGADNGVYLRCGTFVYNKGDTLVLRKQDAPFSYVTLECIDSVTIINEGGQVALTNFGTSIPGGFSLWNCTHIKLTGTGSADQYGFKVSTPDYRGVGVNVYGRSAYIEVDHVDITKKNAGCWVKMEQAQDSCLAKYAFPQWYIHDIYIHDNYIHDNAAEGIYGLSTAPNGNAGTQHAIVFCGGLPDSLLPMRGYHWKIINNIFDSTGRAAIQLSAADIDTSEIAYNTINHCGWDPDLFQGNGISLGTYCRVNVHDNYVNHTKKDGIQAFGALNWLENNFVHNSGNDGMGHTSSASNIFIASQNGAYPSTVNLPYDSTQFIVKNNNLDSNSSGYNIFVETGNGHYKINNNIICGNTHETKIVRAGINYTSNCNAPDTICTTIKTTARDTCCRIVSYTHDTTVIRYYDSLRFHIGAFYKNKWHRLKDSTIAHVPYLKDTITTHDTAYHFLTTPVDTVICTNGTVGIFYLNDGTVSFQHVMDTAGYVGVNWLRLNYTLGSGAPYNVGTANTNNIHVLLTLNNSSNGAAGYGTKADSLITVAAPDWITNDNEPAINDSANIAASLSGLSALITVAHNHNIKVADGGFEKTIFLNYVKDLQDRGKTDSANTIISLYSLDMTSAASIHFMLKNDSLLNAYATMALDANALHWGEPYVDTSVTSLSNYLPEVAHFITRRTGKPVIITELGITNHNCVLLTAMVKQAIQTAVLVFYFDGTGAAGRYYNLQECIKTIVEAL